MSTEARDERSAAVSRKPPPLHEGAGRDFGILLAEDPLRCFVRPYRELGPIFRVALNGQVTTVLAGPEADRFVKKTPDLWSYSRAFRIFKRAAERDPITLDGQEHRIKRRRLNAAFRPAELESTIGPMRSAFREAVAATRGEPVDLRRFLNLAVFQQSCAALELPLADSVFQDTLVAETLLLEGVHRDVGSELDEALESVKNAIRPRLAERFGMRATEEPGMIPAILRNWDPRAEPGLDPEELVEDVALFFRAGVVNTAQTILWALLLLERHPSSREAVAADASRLETDEPVSAARCPAIQASLFETERLRPPIPHLPRVPVRDFELAGSTVERGTTMLHAMTLAHFLEEVHEDPFEFRPERHASRVPDLQAFGSGRHFCVGAPLARLQESVAIAEIFSTWRLAYDFEPSLSYVMKEALTPTEERLPVRFLPKG